MLFWLLEKQQNYWGGDISLLRLLREKLKLISCDTLPRPPHLKEIMGISALVLYSVSLGLYIGHMSYYIMYLY